MTSHADPMPMVPTTAMAPESDHTPKLRRRFYAAAGYYHVVFRCTRRHALITSVADRRELNSIATRTLKRYHATLHAYCLMPDQLRVLIQIDDRSLLPAVRRMATRFARYRQRRDPSLTRLFERPYEATRVDTQGEFLRLLRSIHLAPVVANTAVTPSDYLWSSHRAYLGFKSVAAITTDFGLSLLAPAPTQARTAYNRFVTAGLASAVVAASKEKMDADEPATHRDQCDTAIALLAASTATLPTKHRAALPSIKRLRYSSRRFLSIY